MSRVSTRLVELGIELPPVAAPIASYVPARRLADTIWTSGQLPLAGGELVATGRVGDAVTLEQGVECSRAAALNALAAVASVAGGVDNIISVHRVVVYVASTVDFTDQAKVANGASDVIGEIFGDKGAHVRSAVGVAVLPLDAPVEVELVVEV